MHAVLRLRRCWTTLGQLPIWILPAISASFAAAQLAGPLLLASWAYGGERTGGDELVLATALCLILGTLTCMSSLLAMYWTARRASAPVALLLLPFSWLTLMWGGLGLVSGLLLL